MIGTILKHVIVEPLYLGTVVVLVLSVVLFNAVKKIYNKLKKRNYNVPDVTILKKIIPPHINSGWKVYSVTNSVPVWSYQVTFSFAPKNLYCCRTLLHANTDYVMKELLDIKIFSSLFLSSRNFKLKANSSEHDDRDVISISNFDTSLSLTNILLSQHDVMNIERVWKKGDEESWLYICPSNMLLTQSYGLWTCFFVQTTDNLGSSILHLLTSYPSNKSFNEIATRMSSCLILLKEHIDSTSLMKLKVPEEDVVKADRLKSIDEGVYNQTSPGADRLKSIDEGVYNQTSPVSNVTQRKASTPKQKDYGTVEEPAIIRRVHSKESLKQNKPSPDMRLKLKVGQKSKKAENVEGPSDSTSSTDNSDLMQRAKKAENVEDPSDSTSSTDNSGLMQQVKKEEGVPKLEEEEHHVSPTNVSQKQSGEVVKKETNVSNDQTADRVAPDLKEYEDLLDKAFEEILKIYEADEDTEGWTSLGVKEGVKIFQRNADGEFAVPTFKGTGVVNAPLHYVLMYSADLSLKPEYDSMFDKGSDVVQFSDKITKIGHLQYQGIWPVSARDFCSLSTTRHLKDNIYALSVFGIEHPDCPHQKGKVRGHVYNGGFVYKELSVDPPSVELTYISRASMGGSMPQRIVNKVAAEQTLFPWVMGKHCVRRWKQNDPPANTEFYDNIRKAGPWYRQQVPDQPITLDQPDQLSTSQESNVSDHKENRNDQNYQEEINESPDAQTLDKKDGVTPVSQENTILQTPVLNDQEALTDQLNDHSPNSQIKLHIENKMEDLIEEHETLNEIEDVVPSSSIVMEDYFANDSKNASDDSESITPSMLDSDSVCDRSSLRSSNSYSQLNISEQELQLPRDRFGQVDFLTLGNQAAALLEEEYYNAKKNVSMSSNASLSDVWVSQGTVKNVIIMRKTHPRNKIHSFLGKGLIKVLPITVWEAVKSPTTRFVYDSMLKSLDVVREVSSRNKIIHLRHETHACFVKQARDFCVLHSERVENERYVLAATSVEIPECPLAQDCVRGRVISSGWIVEPFQTKEGRTHTLVTYISQVDFGGRLPTRLINLIAKRQPLALAYLRDYLESAEI